MPMEWEKPKESVVAQLTAARFPDGETVTGAVRTAWVTDSGHAVTSWTDYPRVWDYYRREGRQWVLIESYTTAAGARAVAEEYVIESSRAPVDAKFPLVVQARWKPETRPISVGCSSPKIAEDISSIFDRLGCTVEILAA